MLSNCKYSSYRGDIRMESGTLRKLAFVVEG